jgi:hypothetical protein
MTKEELIEFLKEHLKINVETSRMDENYQVGENLKVRVSLLLDDEEIDCSTDYTSLSHDHD